MADKIVSLEFNVNTGDAVNEINKLTDATDAATAATDNYEEQLKNIKKSTQGAGFRELNEALRQYRDIALQAGENSPIGQQALEEAAELRDRLNDLRAEIQVTGQDGRDLQAALQFGEGIVAGFGAVQGVMALVGSESENLEKTLVKLQAAQTALVSIEEIRGLLEEESALRITATTIAEKARAAATAVSTFVMQGATVAARLFNAALVATGIGAFVVGIGLLIANFDKLKNAVVNNTEGFQTFKKILMFVAPPIYAVIKGVELLRDNMDKVRDTLSRFLPILDSVSAKALENAEKLAEAAQTEKQAVEKRYDFEIEKARAAGKETENLEIEKYNAVNERLRKEQEAIKAQIRITKEATDEQKKRYKELANEILSNNQAVELKKIQIAKKAEDKRREAEKQAAEEAKKRREKAAEEEKKRREEELKEQGKQAEKAMMNRAETLYLLQKLEDETKNDKIKAAQEESDALIASIENGWEKEKKDAERRKQLQTVKVNLALQGFELINQLVNDFDNNSKESQERAFKLNKTFQLAQATIEGYRAVLSTYAQAPGGPGLKAVAAGIAGAFAAAQIVKISQSKFNSAQFDSKVPNNYNKDLARDIIKNPPANIASQSTLLNQPQQQQVIKAVVVESDITKVQNRVQSIIETASI